MTERVLELLERLAMAAESIAASLKRMEPDEEPPAAVEDGEQACPHPPESRTQFGITEGVEDWECRICHFRTTQP